MKTRSFQTFFVSTLLIALAILLGSAPSEASADLVRNESRPWADSVRAALKTNQLLLGAIDLSTNTLPNGIRAQLLYIAAEQTQIWADTILEGDYVVENDVKIDSVETVQMDGIFLGYRITYSSQAYETSACDAQVNIAMCTQGRIVESTFAAPELNAWIRDAKHLADFVPGETF
jgi:hypothetical protein